MDSIFREGQRNSLISTKVRGERGKREIFCGKYREKLDFDINIYFVKIEKNCGLKNQDGGNRKGHDGMSLGTSGVGVCEIKMRTLNSTVYFDVNVI